MASSERISEIERLGEIKGRAHYFADRQEITMDLYSDICWLVERCSWLSNSYERQREGLENIVHGLWGDMTPTGIAASMKVIAKQTLTDTKDDEEAW